MSLLNKLNVAIGISMVIIVIAIGYYVMLQTEKATIEYPDATCCAPIQFNWLGFLVVVILSIILGIVLQIPYIKAFLIGDKHD